MINYTVSDLACERTEEQKERFHLYTECINGIDCIHSSYKDTRKSESITVCLGEIWRYSDSYLQNAQSTVFSCIKRLLNELAYSVKSILIVCLGNRNITVDSLGPKAAEKIIPTRHLTITENKIGVLATGVEGQSGFNAVDIINANLKIWMPDIIITVDSLCSHSPERILTTVQLSTAGILPGSGVGNHKGEISVKTVGIPVISVGVPTVARYFKTKKEKNTEGVSDFYISHLETDIAIDAYATLISKSLEMLYLQ